MPDNQTALTMPFPDAHSNSNAIINAAAYQEGRRVANVELSQVSGLLKQADRFVWIGLHEPSEAVLDQVRQEFGLHELAIEDA
ncbi:MAG: magnesium transporter, partial [Saprospiraceae bacterium]